MWTYDGDGKLETAVDRHLVIATRTDNSWLVDLPSNIPTAVDSPTIVGGQDGVTIAFLVREADKEGGHGVFGLNGTLWTAREGLGEWHATPLQDEAGTFVYAERPLLAANQEETLLAFRRFGNVSTTAGLGQLSLSTAKGEDSFSPPIYLTDQPEQYWQLALSVNPVNEQAILVHVTRAPSNNLPKAHFARIAATESVMYTTATTLALAEDPVAAVTMAAMADPTLEQITLPNTAITPGDTMTVTAVLRNIGRNPAENITVTLYAGVPGIGIPIGTKLMTETLPFNHVLNVEFAITAVTGKQNIYAELTTTGENMTMNNDRAFATLGELTPPWLYEVTESGFTSETVEVSWYPAPGEYVHSYRILRGPTETGPFELIGESVFTSFTDTLVTLGETYCYTVQSYNGDFHLSAQSTPQCGRAGGFEIYLPVVIK